MMLTVATIALPKDRFNGEWRKVSRVFKASISYVEHFIAQHYLKKRPAIIQLCLVMVVDDYPVGCVVYSAPPREADKRYGGKTWELARVYLLDEIPRNAETWLIAQSIKYIKQNHPEVKHLLSYADPSAGHTGVIYKAGNWRNDGRTDQERKTPRCDYVDSHTGKKYGRRGNMPIDAEVVRVPRTSKWRYHYPLKYDGRVV